MKEVEFKRAGITAILMVFFCLGASTIAVSQENPAVKQSRQLMDNDQPTKALSVISEAAKANPADAVLLYYLGRAQLLTGNTKGAEITFQKGIDLNPKEALNLAGKGHLRMVENNTAEAKQFFDQALAATKSKNADVLRAVGEGYLANEKFANDALTVLLKAKSLGDTNPYTYILLGDAYTKLVKGGEAVSSYEKAASLDTKSGFPHYKIGLVYFRSKNFTVAEESLVKAVTIDPNTTLAHKELGEFYYVQKQYAKAVKSYETYLAQVEKSDAKKVDEAQFRMAFFLFANKDYAKANQIFKELIKKPDATPNTFKYAAYSHVESGNGEESRAIFDQYFAKAPKESIQASDYLYQGKMLQGLKQDSLAVIAFKNSLALDKNQPEVQQNVAEMLFKMKKYTESIEAYRTLKSVKPKLSSQDLFSLGRANYIDSLLLEADTTFTKLIELNPNMTVGYLWQARTRSRLDPESTAGLAKPSFELLVEKASANPEKGKGDIIESYLYLGYYHFNKNEVPKAKSYYEKVMALNPDPKSKGIAEEALKAIANIGKVPTPKKDKDK